MTQQLSISLLRGGTDDAGRVACRGCGHDLCSTAEPWKQHARIVERPLNQLATVYTTGSDALLREFICPACGLSLDSEVARRDDPALLEFFQEMP
jgi:acetone carboxylase gamma subunit